jgi:uncharacterized protein
MTKLKASGEFQIFAKPIGSTCNLSCRYCYYKSKESLYPKTSSLRMSDEVLENYITQHMEAYPGKVVWFSWHGGEPTLLGLDYFRKIVAVQRKHKPPDRLVANGVQTNGTLLDKEWCSFFAAEGFAVGLSLDGPREMHDMYRLDNRHRPTHGRAMHGYRLLRKHRVYTDVLCAVNAHNVQFPLQVYRFFKQIEAEYLTFMPVVEPPTSTEDGAGPSSVTAQAWGNFLCSIFDEWIDRHIGMMKIQIFEEAVRIAFNQGRSLCIFRPTCGDVPVVEHNGDFYPCDHYVDAEHRLGNIMDTPLVELLESEAQRTFGRAKTKTLPRHCLECAVIDMCNGGCPKDRFIKTPDGESGLNYLCEGYMRFFTHIQPFVSEVAAQWRRQSP